VAGANVKATTRFGAITPLHLAAERGAGAIVAALVKAGADANAATATGATPLMFAAGAGDVASIAALIDAGAGSKRRNGARARRSSSPPPPDASMP
jgi:ankyrin repeat protein